MTIDQMEKISTSPVNKAIMKLITKHCLYNSELENDMYDLIKLVEKEQNKLDYLKSVMSEIAYKL